jgi:hypothetical protein
MTSERALLDQVASHNSLHNSLHRERPQGRVKLTQSGAQALSDWMAAHAATLVELGEACGTHAMAAKRMITLAGRLSLEQVGQVVAFTRGEVSAEALVGCELAPRVPLVAVAPEPALPEEAAPVPPTAPHVDSAVGENVDVEELARATTPENIETLRRLRDSAKSQSLRARCALALNEIANGKPGQRERQEKNEFPVREEELVEKFRKLVLDARARWEKDHLSPPAALSPSAAPSSSSSALLSPSAALSAPAALAALSVPLSPPAALSSPVVGNG